MSTADLKAVTTGADAKPKDFPAMLTAWLPEIKRALPKHLNADRMARIALTAFRRTPKLAECDPRSVFAAVIQASQLGLEPDTLGRSYLIPYEKRKKINGQWKTVGTECQFVPGWKGLVDLMNRSKEGSVWTGAVFDGDDFEYELGDKPYVRHVPRGEDHAERLTHVYAIGRVKGAEWPVVEVWPVSKVLKHRDRYNKVGERHYSFDNFEMYARKVALLQVLKYMPCSAEMVAAMDLNDAAEVGNQHLGLQDAIDGTWAPVAETEQEPGAPAGGAESKDKGAAKKDGKQAEKKTSLFEDVCAIVENALTIEDPSVALLRLDDAEALLSELSADNGKVARAKIDDAKEKIGARGAAKK